MAYMYLLLGVQVLLIQIDVQVPFWRSQNVCVVLSKHGHVLELYLDIYVWGTSWVDNFQFGMLLQQSQYILLLVRKQIYLLFDDDTDASLVILWVQNSTGINVKLVITKKFIFCLDEHYIFHVIIRLFVYTELILRDKMISKR